MAKKNTKRTKLNYNGGLKGHEKNVFSLLKKGWSQFKVASEYSYKLNRYITRDQVRHLVEVARQQGVNI